MTILRLGDEKEAGVSPESIGQVRNLCKSWVEDGSTPALIVLAARHGIIFLHQAWGKLRPDSNSPAVSLDSFYGVASVSKPVTAAAVMILVERGLIGINHPVQDYIPEFKGNGFENVTVRHLLTHTSGLPYRSEIPYTELGLTDIHLVPGREMSYSNLGYDLLGLIIERIIKKPFREFTHENIFHLWEWIRQPLFIPASQVRDLPLSCR